jgi:hypothetical protein
MMHSAATFHHVPASTFVFLHSSTVYLKQEDGLENSSVAPGFLQLQTIGYAGHFQGGLVSHLLRPTPLLFTDPFVTNPPPPHNNKLGVSHIIGWKNVEPMRHVRRYFV